MQANVAATTATSEPDGVWLAEATAVEEIEATMTLPFAMLTHSSIAELYNSGASQHFSPFHDQFVRFKTIPPRPISAAEKRTFQAVGQGDIYIEVPNGDKSTCILLKDVLYTPSMGVTLISISKLTAAGYSALFRNSVCCIFNHYKKLVGEVEVSNGLYRIKHQSKAFAGAAQTVQMLTMEELHRCLSHISPTMIQEMLSKGMAEGIKLDPVHETMGQCESCENAKATCKPIGKIREPQHCKHFGDKVHSDVWGPAPVQTPGHKSYYALFTNDFTQYMHVTLLAAKSDTFNAYKAYKAWAKMQHDTKIKRLRSDHGGEYLSKEFTAHLKSKGTEQKVTTHNTPQHNGVAEQLNHMLMERICAVGHGNSLPQNLWGEALMHIIWVKNRSASHILNSKTPYELLTGKKPNLQDVPEWGACVWVHNANGSKLDRQA